MADNVLKEEKILNAEGLFHIYESKALDGNVVALNAVSYTHLTLPTKA